MRQQESFMWRRGGGTRLSNQYLLQPSYSTTASLSQRSDDADFSLMLLFTMLPSSCCCARSCPRTASPGAHYRPREQVSRPRDLSLQRGLQRAGGRRCRGSSSSSVQGWVGCPRRGSVVSMHHPTLLRLLLAKDLLGHISRLGT
jgi:hypothetical protein